MNQRRRIAQVNELLREEIGQILIEEDLTPQIVGLTVTEVQTSPDLNHARVYVMMRKGVSIEENEPGENLDTIAERVQRLLAPRIRLKRTPKLRFLVDEAEERAERIEELLKEVKEDWIDS